MQTTKVLTRDDLLFKYGVPSKVLDHGFVRLVDLMGDDASIVRAARVSYSKGTRKLREDRGLLRYLISHKHTSPLEMVEMVVHVKLPIFVERQWVRHRTASMNEVSGRYSELPEEFYIPEAEQVCKQSTANKQGRSEVVEAPIAKGFRVEGERHNHESFSLYQKSLEAGIARETARIHLPLSTYTEKYWKIDGNNLLHFLNLRLDEDAQWEIRQYADVLACIVREWLPLTWEAFEDYTLKACTFSRMEMLLLRDILSGDAPGLLRDVQEGSGDVFRVAAEAAGLTAREAQDFLKKLS